MFLGGTMIGENIIATQERINAVMARAGRMDKALLLAVSKNHPVEAVQAAAEAGISAVGENRVQEAMAKKAVYVGPPIEWHLIGHLQANKVKHAVPLFDLIHSVDSEKLLCEIDRIAAREEKVQRILIQVNVAREDTKTGVSVEDYPSLVAMAQGLSHVKVEGLMCMAPFEEDLEKVRPVFRIASFLFEDLKGKFPEGQIRYLSMGMTHDFEIALEEGANIVRVGTAIFGERDYSL